MMRALILSLVIPAVVLASGIPAFARMCGDRVGGVRVPCDCGDVVVSDTTLQPDDPVVTRRCPAVGLVIRAPATVDSVTVSLNGLAIVGSGRGDGILVERGGSDGAVIVGGPPGRLGEVVGFDIGVHSVSSRAIRRIERIHAKGNRHYGFFLRQAGALLIDLEASQNGADGISILGTGGRLLGARAVENKRSGVVVRAPAIEVNAISLRNGRHGIVSFARGADLSRSMARENGRHGIVAGSVGQRIEGVDAANNGGRQVYVSPRGVRQ